MTTKTVVLCDPPSGWKYGFPREYDLVPSGNPETHDDEVKAWFLSKGYPQEEIDQGMLKYCRWWTKQIEE